MFEFSTSSWTAHGLLGKVRYKHDFTGGVVLESGEPDHAMALLDLPAKVAQDGIKNLELCHFHFPSTSPDYLAELKDALESAGIELKNVLLDRGNLAAPNQAVWNDELQTAKNWQKVAASISAQGCRFDCGTEEPTPEAKERAANALRTLVDHGRELGLIVTTENFRQMSVQPADLFDIMAKTDRPLNLCVDFGNAAKTGDKHATLETLLPHGTSLHCKGEYQDGILDREEFKHSMSLVQESGFSGFISLIYDGTEGEWEKTLELREEIAQYFSNQ